MTACHFPSAIPSKNFISDNTAPMDEAVLKAIITANHLHAAPYSHDQDSRHLEEVFTKKFDQSLKVFPVATGTAANALALSALVRPWGAVLCDKAAHIDNDEGGAPEFYMGGGKIISLSSGDGKITPEKLEKTVRKNKAKGVLAPPLQALSLSQATEFGTIYTKDELKILTETAHKLGLLVHLDGARLGNAIATLGCSLPEITSEIGIDALVFGMGKAGAMAVEPLIIFQNGQTEDALKAMPHLRKRAGQTWSKGRFLAVQALAMLEEDRWLKNSRHANSMTQKLLKGLQTLQQENGLIFDLPYATQANELFLIAETDMFDLLEKQGFQFYRFPVDENLENEIKHIKNPETARFVTSFYTKQKDIDHLLEGLKKL